MRNIYTDSIKQARGLVVWFRFLVGLQVRYSRNTSTEKLLTEQLTWGAPVDLNHGIVVHDQEA
jgi:hypothetical protein